MGKKTIRLNENKLKAIIMEQTKRALRESFYDYTDSGLVDYQGTGSPDSKERMEKIRSKRDSKVLYRNPGRRFENPDQSSYDMAIKKYGGPHSKSKNPMKSFDEFVRPLNDKISSMPEGSAQRKRMWNLYWRLFAAYKEWSRTNKGTSNSPAESKKGEVNEVYGNWFDNPSNARAYDRWKTSIPDEWDSPEYIDKDDFFDMIRSSDAKQQKEFVDYVKDYYSDENEGGVSFMDEFLRQVADGENPFMAAIDLGMDWKEICHEFFDIKPVDYYPD